MIGLLFGVNITQKGSQDIYIYIYLPQQLGKKGQKKKKERKKAVE